MKSVLLALSGGVDSSVAAELLKRQGYKVSGLVMCMSPAHSETVESAKTAAENLGIELFVLDLQEVFKREIIDYFADEYLKGRTPNPCVKCNPKIKFKYLLQFADEHGFDYVATGHYAKIAEENGIYKVYPYHNGDYTTPGEAHYKIAIHTGLDADSFDFDKKLKELTDATYFFVSLGDDDKNIRTASKIRILMKRMGRYPVIHTIVYNPNKQDMLRYGHTVSGQNYDIQPFGDISSTYSEDCILNSELERKALDRHLAYVYQVVESEGLTGKEKEEKISAEEENFWKYDYNYRSSTASVIHSKFKLLCKVPGSAKTPDERTEEEKWFFREMEHQRWNAYVRSEGFVSCETKEQRDKLAKTHHLLVPFKDLPYDEQIKDDN